MKKPILEINHITMRFGKLSAIEDVSFTIEQGQIVTLIGPNGAGKTTLFNCITGYYPPYAGKVIYNAPDSATHDITGLPSHRICGYGITRTFQVVKTFNTMTVEENITAGAFLRTPAKHQARAQAREILEMLGLQPLRNKACGDLTLAQKKRVEIARALATQPQILMLDECMAGLTPEEQAQITGLIVDLRSRGLTFLIVEHITEAVLPISDKVVVLGAGRKIAEGTPEQVVADQRVIRAYLGEKYYVKNKES